MLDSFLQPAGQWLAGVSKAEIVGLILLLTAAVLVSRSIHFLYFHSLSAFPGPIWASVTPFYLTYLFATKKSHLKSKVLHEKYGPIVRMGPNLLSFADPELLPRIYHRTAQKTRFYSTGLAGDTAPLLQIQPHDEHAAKLKVLAPTYSLKNLRIMEDEVNERIRMTMNTLRTRHARQNIPADISEYTRWYVYDTIMQLIYGMPGGFVAQGKDVERLIENWHDMFFLGGLVATLPWLIHPLITSWPLKKLIMPHKGLNYGTGAIMQSHERFFKHRLANPQLARPGNVFDSFVASKNVDGTPFSLADAERECFLLTVASQDTTAAFVSPLISLLATHPAVLQRLREEIADREARGLLSFPICRYEETSSMPYFMACVRETLRLRPPTPIILPRLVSEGGMDLDGKWLPEGTEIGANPWVIHRDQRTFGDDVEVWSPERWLQDPERTRRMNKYDFTWGYGSRKCVGKNIAMMDGQKFVMQLIREFDIAALDVAKPWEYENWGINIYFKQFLQLRERKMQQPVVAPGLQQDVVLERCQISDRL